MISKEIFADEIPHLCHIELTYECNQNCIFCYNPLRGSGVDINKIDTIVDRVHEAKIPNVYLIGGEPSVLGTDKLNEYIEKLSESSSVTIVTNGYIKLEGISDNLACIAVPLHGHNAETHEAVNKKRGSFEKAINSIKYYVSRGLDVRCVVVLTGYNYDKMLDIISLAASLGMESVYIDRYEDGGIGASNSDKFKLKPSLDEFRHALTDIIEAKDKFKNFNGKIGFGTAIPFCIDERMFHEKILSSCGAGSTFCAINHNGEVRLCNQSDLVYGNILKEDMIDIWKNKKMSQYRNLEWVDQPCKSCELLMECQGGCRVDSNCSKGFCIDYAIRERDTLIEKNMDLINSGILTIQPNEEILSYRSDDFKSFVKNKYLRIHSYREEDFVVTQYQTTKIGKPEKKIMDYILKNDLVNEKELINKFSDYVEDTIKLFICYLQFLGAIEIKGVLLNDL